jgi:AcrR family transcriptional regulator
MVDPTIQTRESAHDAFQTEFEPEQGRRAAAVALRGAPMDDEEIRVPDSTQNGGDTEAGGASDEALADQSGRPLGKRALQTRQRILDATTELLAEKPLRDLRVIDIARLVGSSPATFYQYFKDVEDVVLHLAGQVTQNSQGVVKMIRGEWTGPEGYERARALAQRGIEHWDTFGPILRVRNSASDEGDERFQEIRARAMIPIVTALAEEIEASHQRALEQGQSGSVEMADPSSGRIDPMAGAMAIFAVIDRMAMYHQGVERRGVSRDDIVDTIATLAQFILTSRK